MQSIQQNQNVIYSNKETSIWITEILRFKSQMYFFLGFSANKFWIYSLKASKDFLYVKEIKLVDGNLNFEKHLLTTLLGPIISCKV